MIAMMEELLTPRDAARLLNMSEYTVREKLKAGEIPGFMLGGRWKIRPEALRRFVEEQEQEQQKDKK